MCLRCVVVAVVVVVCCLFVVAGLVVVVVFHRPYQRPVGSNDGIVVIKQLHIKRQNDEATA